MQDKKVIFYAIGALILIVGLAYFLVTSVKKPVSVPVVPANPSPTHTSVSADTLVPNANATSVPADVAKPDSVKQIGVNDLSKRDFSVSISQNAVTPQKVVIYVGDLVNISFTAADGDYDMIQPDYGLSFTVKNGQTKTISGFQGSSPGQFTFYCKSCGGPAKGPVGYIVLVPKK